MVDFLAAWGVSSAVGFLFQPVMAKFAEDLGKDVLKDIFKDVFKGIGHQGLQRLKKEEIDIAFGKALKEFLSLVEQELQDADFPDQKVKEYIQPLKVFLNDKRVKEILANTFKPECQDLNTKQLEERWYELDLLSLPDGFNWKQLDKRYVKKVKAIIEESPKLRDIRDSQNLDDIALNTRETAGIIPEFDLEQYQQAIKERYGNLKLDSLDTSGYAYNELKLWRMFIAQNVREVHELLPQIHEIPKEHQRRLRESNQLEAEIELEQLERYRQTYREQPIRSVLDIVNDQVRCKYIVILGDPGSGKSTLLQYLALNWAETPLNNVISLPIPLLIELRTYMRRRDNNECNNFLEFFHKCSGVVHHLNQNKLHEKLRNGKALVMFDGLDEVFDPAKREDIITDIHRFTNEYPNVQTIVTSRVFGYKPQRLRDAEFRHFMLQDLEPEQIQDFINRWHELTFQTQADKNRKKELLKKAIETSKAIVELAGNPLLLTMMAILNRHQELPRDRPELYNQASRVLLHQWDVERALIEDERLDPKTIDYKDKQAILRQVAYKMQTSEKGLAGNLISAVDLENTLTNSLKDLEFEKPRSVAKVMIHQMRTRNFMLCFLGADYYAFVHRTFLEYFCAWEFVWQFEKEQKITLDYLKSEVFGKHWQDETWHEVLHLIAGMIDAKFVGEILDNLMAQNGEEKKFSNIFLAAKCLTEVRNRSVIGSIASKLLNRLKELTKYDLWYYYEPYRDDEETKLVQEIRTQAVAAVATSWQESPDTLSWLKSLATDDDNWDVRYAAVQELARGFKDDPDTLTFVKSRVTNDDNRDVRYVAVQELARRFKDDPDTLTFLKSHATNEYNRDVRYAAVRELAQGFKDDPDTVTILKFCATDDNDRNVRTAAVQELARGFKDDPDTLTILKSRTTDDTHPGVRYAAVQELARGFKNDPDTLRWLKSRVTDDDNWVVRSAAVQELARSFKNDPDTLTILKSRATNDDNWDVRSTAVQELARSFKNDPDTLRWLKSRTTDDDDSDVRTAAVQELARGFKNDPDTLTILKSRATDDDDWVVRRAAVQELARSFKNDPDTLTILKSRATDDDDRFVRYAAVQELAQGFKDDPATFDIFYNCAIKDPFRCEEYRQDNPRRVALKAIIKHYSHYPQTLPLLRDKAENDPDEQVRVFAKKNLAKLEKYGGM
ncbi:HEAT repeat domain-containing protein [Aetokthonos hydrillicola Thurmond2011]|jgi:predicted NACHT family NTPase|uniref:HEAT repeat domain-containing protein n=1 Tax=Aetokthonos hydrillicola Thurmond2011 TaxID=2712845 RepID=A0AAP5MCD6_9CYAN|nr:HEAT repeat domain-containing protein [Aetokthonos hydrillicola]MBO3461914.1 NACHT domain-containing protein [Aetokthonos hydrillicola CCALA 1050]MBW4585421.1 HEAT repeat domain-containing protein [Aetokthonos hydrillicola CCALA 1050]MDR9899072.1 HEAT repeat domain-containing protein [Aetokthonos hydrillicola Thurmond2011]